MREKEEAERELAATTEALESLGVEVDELRQEKEEENAGECVFIGEPSEHSLVPGLPFLQLLVAVQFQSVWF